jgi:hypothetical protein
MTQISFFQAMKNILLGRSSLFGMGVPIMLGALLFIGLLLFFEPWVRQEDQEKSVLIGTSDTWNSSDTTNENTRSINGQCTHTDSTGRDSVR